MKYDVMSQTAKLLQQYKKNKRWLAVFLCLAVTVVLGTLAALKLYGQAMTHKVKVLECKYEVHEHTEECYDEENGEELICVYADYVVHMHNDDCYDAEGKLLCPLEEVEPHEHTEECYEEVKVLVCEEETAEPAEGENAGAEGTAQNNEAAQEPVKGDLACTQEEHTHGEGCYSRMIACEEKEHVHEDACYSNELICEGEEHTHGEGCYDEEGNLICTAEEHTHNDGCYNQELICEVNEHTHGEGCYNSELVCETEEHEHADTCYQQISSVEDTHEAKTKEHVHTDACYVTEKVLACGKLELHTHTDECYAKESFDEEGKLIEGSLPICGLLQLEEHVHGEECFVTVELTPEEVEALKDGAALHVHDEKCYDEEGNLICGHEATHIHGLDCYDEEGKLICELAETHVHSEECYDAEGNLICGHSLGAHVHEAKCYNEEGKLICGYETAAHPHVASCYDAEGNLQCGYETAAHVHEESCYDEEGNVICGYAAASHVHGKECYDENGTLICGYETAKHVHEDSCYDQEGNLVCGYNENGLAASALYCDESIHTHDADCYDAEGNLVCGKADFAVHKHTDDCYNINGVLICPLPEAEAHVHGAECYPEGTAEGGAEPACGKQEIRLHTHTEDCRDENGALICGQLEILEHVHGEACRVSNRPITKTFEGGSFIVTAVYKPDANIPEEAELIAEQITEESDSEHYAKRQAEYQEALGDSKATMRALLKVGFYVNGEEVEPESPVTLTIQFLDENGLAEGKPVTVIHFAEEGAEVLEGSEVQDGSTTFEMDSFSEIGVGDGQKSVRVPINEELTYETDEFEVTFHIEGEVSVPVGNTESEEETGMGEETDESGDSAEEETEESGAGESAVADDAEAGTEDAEASEGSENDEAAADRGTEEDVIISEEGVSVIIENSLLDKKLEFRVDPLSEDAEEYSKAAAAVYADGTDGAEELDDQLFLQVLSYKVLYDGQKLDLSDCVVTAEVKPSEALVEYAETALDPMTLDLYGEEQIADGLEVKPEVVITAIELTQKATDSEIIDAMVVGYEALKSPMLFSLNSDGDEGIAAISITSQANPTFTVQFYANIKKLVMIDAATMNKYMENKPEDGYDGYIAVIDTSGGWLPTNDDNMAATKRKGIHIVDNCVQTEEILEEIYTSETYNYISKPGLTYFNKLAKNDNYILSEIWVKEKGQTEWTIKKCEGQKEWHFTNKEETQKKYPNEFILVTDGMTIRLVHEVKKVTKSNGADFYDYDISDGQLYKYEKNNLQILTAEERGDVKTHNGENDSEWYMYTNKQGINSNLQDQTFGFGNSEGLAKTTLGDLEGNKANSKNAAYGSPTFGLVTGLNNGKIQYASHVKAPALFNDEEPGVEIHGKTSYAGNLIFRQEGDTYTLTGAEVIENGKVVSGVENIDVFKRQRPNWNNTYYFAGNDFYPMDTVSTAGTNGHDLMFGAEKVNKLITTSATKDIKIGKEGNALQVPASDDGLNHNHYFGMHYTISFDLVEDYIGPLEYLFYGDDDMWVFLDGGKYNGKLICDIGGVHSSVGEYIDLWDYIDKGSKGHYTLTFFYTERGASGSTCWMQFTLPSVSFATTEQDTGMLRIEKEVTGPVTSEDFGFEVKFKDKDGNDLKNDYSYTKYDKSKITEQNPEGIVERDILIWNNSKFTLKAGEYIIINFLPDGAEYTIKEVGPVKVNPKEPGQDMTWGVLDNPYDPEISGGTETETKGEVTGWVTKNSTVTIKYNNVLRFALPETGGPGTIILYTMAGAIVLLGGAGFLYKRKFRERRA